MPFWRGGRRPGQSSGKEVSTSGAPMRDVGGSCLCAWVRGKGAGCSTREICAANRLLEAPVCASVRVCLCASARVCVCARVRVCVCACARKSERVVYKLYQGHEMTVRTACACGYSCRCWYVDVEVGGTPVACLYQPRRRFPRTLLQASLPQISADRGAVAL